ncbi:MAG: 3-oxo-5-alpha-steroid 4-dehydrogenase [Alphaproteobacteria bacterium]|nr:3-oxo-5-alpha-steroid 4-dehydrogenase [Alphaproteobacteria bacterium]
MGWTGDPTYDLALTAGLAFAVVTAVASRFVTTPYGRFASTRLGPTVPQRIGWLLLEVPALIVFPAVYALGPQAAEPVPLGFAALWLFHYANRALFFPLRMKVRPGARMGLVVPLTGWFVVPLHAWLYATWYARLGTHLTPAWLTDPRFGAGLATYAVGQTLVLHSEAVLRGLRAGDDSGYHIPQGGGFRWVSSPHYLGEILAFTGMALASWCPGGLFVLTITLANLVPRAAATHAWYRQTFPDYPPGRRALLPGVW